MTDDFENAPSLRCHMWARGAVVEPNPSLAEIERWKQCGWIVESADGYRLSAAQGADLQKARSDV